VRGCGLSRAGIHENVGPWLSLPTSASVWVRSLVIPTQAVHFDRLEGHLYLSPAVSAGPENQSVS
jgi:hypothetical protein